MNILRKLALVFSHPRLMIRPSRTMPDCLQVHTNWACNARCAMCSVASATAANHEYLAWEHYAAAADSLAGVARFAKFWGGECTLHSRLCDMLRHAVKRGYVTEMITNGLLLSDIARDLCDTGLHRLVVSFDGYNDLTFEARTKVPGTCKKVVEGMEAVLKHRGKRLFPELATITTPTVERIQYVNEILTAAAAAGADERMVTAVWWHPQTIADANSAGEPRGAFVAGLCTGKRQSYLEYPQWAELCTRIGMARGPIVINAKVLDYSWWHGGEPRTYRCAAMDRVGIGPGGELTICNGTVTIGHVRDGLRRCWAASWLRREIKQLVSGGANLPMCYRCCAKERQ